MKLSTLREGYESRSVTASERTRSLALSGLAVIWLFKETDQPLPPPTLLPLLLFAASLGADACQYLWSSAILGHKARAAEKAGLAASYDVPYDRMWNWPTLGFFWLKHIALVAGFSLLLRFVWRQVIPA